MEFSATPKTPREICGYAANFLKTTGRFRLPKRQIPLFLKKSPSSRAALSGESDE
jgi:hypothetical protein